MKLVIATVLSAFLIGPASAFAIPADVHVQSSSLGAGPSSGQVVDLRSPDAQAAAAAAVTPVHASSVTPSSSTSDFDWGDAAIGAGTVLALSLLALGAVVITGSAKRHRSTV